MNFNKEKKTGTILDFFKKSNTFNRNDNSTNNNYNNNGMQSPQAEKRTFYDLTEDDDFEDNLIMYEQKALSSSHFTQKNNKQRNNVGANSGNINASFQSTNYVKSSSGLVLPNKNKTIINNNSQHSSSSSIQASHVIDMPSYNKFTLTNKHQYKKTLPQFSSQENDAIILDLEDSSSSNNNSMESIPIKHKIYPKFSKPINLPVYNPEKVVNSYHIPEDYIPAATPTLESRPSRDLPSSFKKASSLISESNSNTTSGHLFRHNSSTTFVKPNPYGSSRFGSSSSNKIMNNFFSAGSTVTPIPTFNNISNHNTRFNNMPPSKKSRTYISSFKKNSQDDYTPTLSNEQQRVLSMVLNERKSLFFTGSAGTGKSVLLRAIIKSLKDKYKNGVAVTASTGIAACNISGTTLHSFAGIGLGNEELEKLKAKVMSNKKANERWLQTKVLIIDEISMVDGELFDKLEGLARIIRGSNAPFGGIQLIVTGDFFQLPPVNQHRDCIFTFESKTWSKVINSTVMLTHVFRQKDQRFVDILNEMRLGKLSDEAIQLFKSLDRSLPESTIEPTELYPLRRQVEMSNNTRLEALKGDYKSFSAVDTGDKTKVEWCIAPATIRLKKNAQVMLLKNFDSKLVNGSLGIVVGFAGQGKYRTKEKIYEVLPPNRGNNRDRDTEKNVTEIIQNGYPIVQFMDGREIVIENDRWTIELPGGKEIASRSQVPLLLAWAMSIHKSQGQTLERVRVDLGQIFEKGQAYVALSRATSLESLQILNFQPSKVQAHPRVTKFYSSLQTI